VKKKGEKRKKVFMVALFCKNDYQQERHCCKSVFIKHEQACLGGGERNGISLDAKGDSFMVG
jgi:hypothetical protein